jgi:hypothetical protein
VHGSEELGYLRLKVDRKLRYCIEVV